MRAKANWPLRRRLMMIIGGALFVASVAYTQGSHEDAYRKHLDKVRRLLPPHSALPPLLDLSKARMDASGATRAWENRFTGMMSVRGIRDPGISYPSDVASIATTFTEYGTPVWALPAHDCVVIVGEPISSAAHMAYNRRFVYSTFTVETSVVLKADRRYGIREGGRITVAQFGGTVRFPSGHIATFLMAREGFIDLDHRYLFFIWKPIQSDNTYVIAEAYLIHDGLVYPVNFDAHESRYAGMPFKKFEIKVKVAIAKNVDTN